MDHYHHEDSTPLPSPLSRFKIKESLIEEEANEKKKINRLLSSIKCRGFEIFTFKLKPFGLIEHHSDWYWEKKTLFNVFAYRDFK